MNYLIFCLALFLEFIGVLIAGILIGVRIGEHKEARRSAKIESTEAGRLRDV